jgi:hypothetical protein
MESEKVLLKSQQKSLADYNSRLKTTHRLIVTNRLIYLRPLISWLMYTENNVAPL